MISGGGGRKCPSFILVSREPLDQPLAESPIVGFRATSRLDPTSGSLPTESSPSEDRHDHDDGQAPCDRQGDTGRCGGRRRDSLNRDRRKGLFLGESRTIRDRDLRSEGSGGRIGVSYGRAGLGLAVAELPRVRKWTACGARCARGKRNRLSREGLCLGCLG